MSCRPIRCLVEKLELKMLCSLCRTCDKEDSFIVFISLILSRTRTQTRTLTCGSQEAKVEHHNIMYTRYTTLALLQSSREAKAEEW